MRLPPFLRHRAFGVVASVAAVLALGALLTATIYWTLFDPKWIAFLGGVLFAAMLAAASRASTIEWRLLRRTRQVEQLRAKLAREQQRARAASEAFQAVDARMRLLGDALPCPIFFVDRDVRCHFHNTAAAIEARRARTAIDSQSLAESIGMDPYAALAPSLSEAFRGRETAQALAGLPGGGSFEAHCVPFPRNDPNPTGAFVILSRSDPVAAVPSSGLADDHANDLALLRASTGRIEDWDEPRAKLARALQENQFLLLAQPLAALKPADAGTQCCEILLRLKEEEDNLLPPGSFFPVAERYGMMEELDRWVVRELISRCHEHRRMHEPAQPMLYCVNLSRAAASSHAFARFVQTQLIERSFDGGALCFEIAENDIAPCHAEVARLISMLKPLGCRFTVDAFGSVNGAFSALKGLAFDFIKIDGVVIQNMRRHPADLAKVRAIVTVCRQAGMRTIAEFVEDPETLAALRAAGVDYAQGFGIAHPAPLSDLFRDNAQPSPALAAAA